MRDKVGGVTIPFMIIAMVLGALWYAGTVDKKVETRAVACQDCLMIHTELQALRIEVRGVDRQYANATRELAWSIADITDDKGLINYMESVVGCNRCHGGQDGN